MDIAYAPYFKQVFTDENGLICANGSIEFYSAGSSLRVPVFDPRTYANLGFKLKLNANGSAPDYALNVSQTVDIYLYSEEGKLIRVFTEVKATAGSSISGDFIPMDGTQENNPVRGPVVWQNEQDENSVSSTGLTLKNSLGGQTQLTRDGLTTQVANDKGEYLYNHLILSNTQNGIAGYPDNSKLTPTSLKITKNLLDAYDNRVEKSIEIVPTTSLNGYNKITSKGNLEINNWPGNSLKISSSENLSLHGDNIELVPMTGNVIVGNNKKLITTSLGIGTNLNNKTVTDIWTSTSTGAPTDDQLITAKAALQGGGGSTVTTSGGVQGDGSALDPVTLKLDNTGTVTLSQGPDGLKAIYTSDDEEAEYMSFPFTMSTHLLSRPCELILVPIHIDWSSYIRSVKFYNGTLGGASQPYLIVLYHVIGDINSGTSTLEPFAYYYKADSSTDIERGK